LAQELNTHIDLQKRVIWGLPKSICNYTTFGVLSITLHVTCMAPQG